MEKSISFFLNIIHQVSVIILFSIILIVTGCKKDNNESSKYTTPPVIILKGSNPQNWEFNQSPYIDPGDTAYDKIDGDLTKLVVITGTVNTNVQDTYKLYYNVKNKGGLSAVQKIRTVIVKPFK